MSIVFFDFESFRGSRRICERMHAVEALLYCG